MGNKTSGSTSGMSNFPSNLSTDIIALNTKLIRETQEAHGQFCTKTRHAVLVSDPVARKRIQSDLDHGVGLFCAAHVMSMFEKAIPSKYWQDIYDPDDLQLLKALRHIRLCAASGFSGDRVQDDALEFDAVMTSSQPLRGVVTFDADKIRFSERVGIDVVPILQSLANKALIKIS